MLQNEDMRVGEYNDLVIQRETRHGVYLSDGKDDLLLPGGQCPPRVRIGDTLRVFVLTDSEDRPIATTRQPYATAGEFAKLRLLSMTPVGAFFDWGLDKDLFCPLREQRPRMQEGADYIVYIYVDELTHRVVCSTRLHRFLEKDGSSLKPGQPVRIRVLDRTPDMIVVAIDGKFKGAIFPDEWHGHLAYGEVQDAYVKSVRPEDGRVAISLRPQGYHAVLGERDRILKTLRDNGGLLLLSDKSPPEDIQRILGLSKGAFKKLIGSLYKEGLIEIEARVIRLKPSTTEPAK